MKNLFFALGIAAVLAITGCQAKSKQESTVDLNGVQYRIIGAERVEARANNQVRKTRDDKGVESETKVISQTIELNGKHKIEINGDGSFTVDGTKQTVSSDKKPTTIRLDGDKVIIE